VNTNQIRVKDKTVTSNLRTESRYLRKGMLSDMLSSLDTLKLLATISNTGAMITREI
jgi:hypothetical protein